MAIQKVRESKPNGKMAQLLGDQGFESKERHPWRQKSKPTYRGLDATPSDFLTCRHLVGSTS
jgi:hypothetical protein